MRKWCIGAAVSLWFSVGLAQTAGDKFTQFQTFTLGQTTLQDVRHSFGPAQIIRTGDAAGSLTSLCYSTPAGFLTFLAGELDGGKYVGGVRISESARRSHCAPPSAGPKRNSLEIGGVHLGMSVREFQNAVHAPLKWAGAKAEASFESKRKIEDVEYDVLVTVSAKFREGRLAEVEVWRAETN